MDSVAWEPDLTLVDGAFRRGVAVTVTQGRIRGVGSSGGVPRVRLPGRALIPGLVNGHSHAFQRLIRGRVQRVPAQQPEADFWTWRTRMYQAATRLSPEDIEVVSRFCYVEMLRAGFTSVGEFHYLHHQADGAPYPDPARLSQAVIAAAQGAGIRLCLLPVAYARAGHRRALEPEQRRFVHPDPGAFLALVDRLQARVPTGSRAGPTVGVAVHSVRAVPRSWLEALGAAAQARSMPLHIHAAEQPAEIEQCLEEHGLRPVALLAETGMLGPRTAVVHGIHLEDDEIAALAAARSTVVVCPTTERDLGDGIAPAAALAAAGVPLALGSDSHAQLDPFAEMRALEGHERLRRLRRCILKEGAPREGSDELQVAPVLFGAATVGGGRALGLPVGSITAGMAADLVSIDLDAACLAGCDEDTLLDGLVFAANPGVVRDVIVGGQRVVADGVHPGMAEARAAFAALARRLWA